MQRILLIILLGLLPLMANGAKPVEKRLLLEEVPAEVMQAAQKELKNFTALKAEVDIGKVSREYELIGLVDSTYFVVDVLTDNAGKLIKISSEKLDLKEAAEEAREEVDAEREAGRKDATDDAVDD